MSDKADPDPEGAKVLKCISVKKIARTATPNSQRTPGFTTTEKSSLPENVTERKAPSWADGLVVLPKG
jgi:hypothetical protein